MKIMDGMVKILKVENRQSNLTRNLFVTNVTEGVFGVVTKG